MKITVMREIKAKDYSSGNLSTFIAPIQNSVYRPGGRGSDLAEFWNKTVTNGPVLHALLGDNRKRFAKRFGKPAFHFRSEFDFHCWPLKLEEKGRTATVLLMTAARKGTCYEYLGGAQDEQLLVKFLESIVRMR